MSGRINQAWAFGKPAKAQNPSKKELNATLHMEQDGLCAYCGHYSDHLQVDHIVPQASGGNDDRSNLVGACFRCNSSKGKRSADWMKDFILTRRISYEMFVSMGDAL